MSEPFTYSASGSGALRIDYAAHVEMVCIEIRESGQHGGLSMQMTREQAIEMRAKLDTAIEMAGRATCEPCSGKGVIRFDGGGLSLCEDCAGEGVVPR